MTLLSRLLRRRWPIARRDRDSDHVDVSDHSRRIAIREAEYQAGADAHSRVLRVAGKCPLLPFRPRQAIVTRGKGGVK